MSDENGAKQQAADMRAALMAYKSAMATVSELDRIIHARLEHVARMMSNATGRPRRFRVTSEIEFPTDDTVRIRYYSREWIYTCSFHVPFDAVCDDSELQKYLDNLKKVIRGPGA